MAKSFYDIIEKSEEGFEVTHRGYEVVLELPEWVTELAGTTDERWLEDPDKIWAWAQRHGIELAFCHRAIAQMIIDLRAAARPSDVKGEPQNIKADTAQKALDAYEFKPTKRPGAGAGGAKKIKAQAELETIKKLAIGMIEQGMEDDAIKGIFAGQFERAVLSQALNLAHTELGDD